MSLDRPSRTRRLTALGAAVLATTGLQGCFPLAATGLAVGGLAFVDRRTLGAQTDDQAIELRGSSRLRQANAKLAGVSVTSFNRKVLLTGQVPDEAAQREAEVIAARVDNVRSVHNETVVAPRASVSTATSDTALTARVKAAFVEARDLQSNAVKVVTEYGAVYLMGLVTRREGDRAAQVASQVSGVQKVVTLYEYLTDEELANLQKGSGAGSSSK
jgi:osmotically-inducible protein OsmY